MSRLDSRQRAVAEALIRTEWPKLEAFFKTKVPPSEVEELGQITILAYVERLDVAERDPRAYLWQIARNQVARHWERYLSRRGAAFDSSQHGVLDVGPSLSSLVAQRDQVQRALLELPLDHMTAVELRYVMGLTVKEIMVVLGVSDSTVDRYLASATQHLAARLGPDAERLLRERE